MKSLDKDILINLIKDKFNQVPKPLSNEIISHRCFECDKLRDDFVDFEHFFVPDKIIKYHSNSLPLFAPRALRYYLPDYMIYSIKNPDSDCCETTIFELSPKEIDEYHKKRISAFSALEKEVIVEFIKFIKLDDDEGYFEEYYDIALKIWGLV